MSLAHLSLHDALKALQKHRYMQDLEQVVLTNALLQLMDGRATCVGPLQLENPWRWGPLSNALSAADVALLVAMHALPLNLTRVLEIATFAGDLGLVTPGTHPSKYGKVGVAALETLRPKSEEPDSVMMKVLVHISTAITFLWDGSTPNEGFFGEQEGFAFLLCLLLRDLRRMSVLIDKGRAYLKPTETARQKVVNNLTEDAYVPENVIVQFEAGETIDQTICGTTLGQLVHFLAWKFDFTYPELWEQVVTSGVLDKILVEIREKLCAAGNTAQWNRIKAAALRNGIVNAIA